MFPLIIVRLPLFKSSNTENFLGIIIYSKLNLGQHILFSCIKIYTGRHALGCVADFIYVDKC